MSRLRPRGPVLVTCVLALLQCGAAQQPVDSVLYIEDRIIVPLEAYVSVTPVTGRSGSHSLTIIDASNAEDLVVHFDRTALPPRSGPQFVRIATSVWDREGTILDNVTQYAFTFPRAATPEEEEERMNDYARQILQFGFMSPGRCDSVQIVVDTLPEWGRVRIEVLHDEEYTKYTNRSGTRLMWTYTIRGGAWENRFTLGVPKVLYDTRSQDSVDYGNVSALLRFHYRNRQTGEIFPVSAGFGVYGVTTPLDVTDRGGGFLISVYFNILQYLRNRGLEVTDRANIGLEFAPFFPVGHRSRFIISARIGYTP